MRTEYIKVQLSDGVMSAYVAYPDKTQDRDIWRTRRSNDA
jgi:hypothetical protein